MVKQTIYAISNREKFVCYTLGKDAAYYDFLFSLLKTLNINIPDLYDGMTGKLPDINKEKDECSFYESNDSEVIEVIGAEKIFLIVYTKNKDKLLKFIEKNTEFIKTY